MTIRSIREAKPECPLCRRDTVRRFADAGGRRYFECSTCALVFLAPDQRLERTAERARYDTHENDPSDPRYRAFLSRVADPLVERLSPGAEGLDYGSGPGPTLSVMLEEKGFRVEIYDPFYAPDTEPLDRNYDFVTCTETAEHFFDPREEFERLNALIRPGGLLAVMTEILRDEIDFQDWHYARDPTHVCFYRPATLLWICHRFGWSLEMPHPNVALFRKHGHGSCLPSED
jgi:hypothetical protein